MVALVKRLDKGNPLTYEEMDGNLDSIGHELDNKVSAAASSIAIINAVENLKGGVSDAADTLLKLHNFIISLENNKINTSNIIDNVTQTDTDKPLSAYQGKLLRDALTLEINTRISTSTGDVSILQTAINDEITARITALNTETTNRINADNTITNRIDNLLTNIDTTALNSLAELVTAFQLADSNLLTAINNLSTNASSSLNTEIINRTTAIDSEIQNRQIAIATEVENRNIAIAQAVSGIESRLYSI